jgi:hypothetical protein
MTEQAAEAATTLTSPGRVGIDLSLSGTLDLDLIAEAALAAMAEPTEAMLYAAWITPTHFGDPAQAIHTTYRAMIRAAATGA